MCVTEGRKEGRKGVLDRQRVDDEHQIGFNDKEGYLI